MKRLLTFLATGCIWIGVAVIANTWVNMRLNDIPLWASLRLLYSPYQFWIAVVFFIGGAELYYYCGKLDEREKKR